MYLVSLGFKASGIDYLCTRGDPTASSQDGNFKLGVHQGYKYSFVK